jgi:4-hydroxybenzoate polyprenyltransferase
MSNLRTFWDFARPFTLLTPAAGMVAGGLIAWGADPRFVSISGSSPAKTFLNIAAGALMASIMNAGSNGLNQIFDLEIDRINKPRRPLPSGRLTLSQAWSFTIVTLVMGLLLAWVVSFQCLALAATAGLLTASYSVPPARTKRWGWIANITVAIPRGLLLPVAGWSAVKTIMMPEPWLLSFPLGLFMFGANSTKDFSDIEGDRAGGCMTLPVRYGVRRTALIMAPFFVFPFALWALFARLNYLSAPAAGIYLLAASLPLLGAYIDYRILRDPEELGKGENHISWRLIYLMAMLAFAGLTTVYLWPR